MVALLIMLGIAYGACLALVLWCRARCSEGFARLPFGGLHDTDPRSGQAG